MRAIILLCALSAAAFAQIDNNVITVTASRQLNSQPDQVSIGVTVSTDEKQTLDSVLAALPGGITAANLTAVSGYGTGQVQWIFTLTVPMTSLTSTVVALNAAAGRHVFTIDYYVQGSSVSAQATASQQCPYPALLSDARAQAAKLAAAAGVTLGQIVALAQGIAQAPETIARIGVFSSGLSSLLLGLPVAFYNPLTTYVTSSCSLTVQFSLAH